MKAHIQPIRMRLSSGRPPWTGKPTEGAARLEGAVLATPVLVVEDEAMIAWTMESLLEEMGFTSVSIAATGEDAIAMAAQIQPGIIISDINLGQGMDGVEAAAAIWRDAKPSVVFITGYASAEAKTRIERDVPDALMLRKPVALEELYSAIAEAVARKGAH